MGFQDHLPSIVGITVPGLEEDYGVSSINALSMQHGKDRKRFLRACPGQVKFTAVRDMMPGCGPGGQPFLLPA